MRAENRSLPAALSPFSAAAAALRAALQARDGETGLHMQRVGLLTRLLLETLARRCPEAGLTPERIFLCGQAAALHDAGKLALPDEILKKPGPLTEKERAVMREHPVRGCEILQAVPALSLSPAWPLCRDIARWHHERWDGGGYSDGLRGGDIPLPVQAAAVADVYDALVSPRPYHAPLPHKEAAEQIIQGEAGAFSPLLCQVLAEAAPRPAVPSPAGKAVSGE